MIRDALLTIIEILIILITLIFVRCSIKILFYFEKQRLNTGFVAMN